MTGDDRDLSEYFAAVRREEQTRVPAFPLMARDHAHWGASGRLVAAAVCLMATVVAGVRLLPLPRAPHAVSGESKSERQQIAASITSWRSDTNFLLDTPGRELLREVPPVGDWDGAAVLPAPGHRLRHFNQHVLP